MSLRSKEFPEAELTESGSSAADDSIVHISSPAREPSVLLKLLLIISLQ